MGASGAPRKRPYANRSIVPKLQPQLFRLGLIHLRSSWLNRPLLLHLLLFVDYSPTGNPNNSRPTPFKLGRSRFQLVGVPIQTLDIGLLALRRGQPPSPSSQIP
jgi:hypothetical protein